MRAFDNVSYDWKGQGESNYDLIRVALVPASVELVAGTAMPAGLSGTGNNLLGTELPAGWISLDGGKLNLSSAWQRNSIDVNIEPGLYNVVILWRNDGSGGTQTPAGAIDNFKDWLSLRQLQRSAVREKNEPIRLP